MRALKKLAGTGLILGAAAWSGQADACGGLFCSNSQPVNQAAERIIFAQNDDDTVSAVIEIQYEGPTHEFAWVLPIPEGELDVGVSSVVVLDRLQQQSNPLYQLQVQFEEGCNVAMGGGVATPGAGPLSDSAAGEDGQVAVLESGQAGPYVYERISVKAGSKDPEDAALEWLDENGYDVGDLGPEALRPYLEMEQTLLAFKLSKGNDAGSIRPVFLRYEGDELTIPIRPTAVAAMPNMGIMVWVLGNARAYPETYLHLELNHAKLNWFNPNSNYNDVVIAAADEAGGQGFVTEQAGPAGAFAEAAYAQFEQNSWQQLRTGQFSSIQEFLQQAFITFGSYDGFTDLLRDEMVVPLREGATAEQLAQCLNCYFQEEVAVQNESHPDTPYDPETDPLNDMDVLAFLDRMDELVIQPLSKSRDLFESHSTVTRFYTTLSPDEMTVDPVFGFNADLPDYDNLHQATQIMSCQGSGNNWTIELPQGMKIEGSGRNWPDVSELPNNLRILQLGAKGEGKEVEDNSAEIAELLSELNIGSFEPSEDKPGASSGALEGGEDPTSTEAVSLDTGGGCSLVSAGAPGTALWLLLGLGLFAQRRRI